MQCDNKNIEREEEMKESIYIAFPYTVEYDTKEEKEKLLRSIISGRIIAVTTAHGYIERVKGKAFVVCDINVQMKK